jgi:dipeptidyl aminopeptidase/acylaminoacyl peptidase
MGLQFGPFVPPVFPDPLQRGRPRPDPTNRLILVAVFFLSGCAGLQTATPSLSPPVFPTTLAPPSPTQAPTVQNTPTASVAPSATPVVSSPAGLIAYVGPDNQLWLMQADGSNQQELTTGETVVSLAWSHDGHRLAFGQQHPLITPIPIGSGNSIDLAVLEVVQGTTFVVLEGSSTVLYTPQGWLPDGRLLYDRLDWDPATQTGKDSLWTVTVDDTVGVPQPAANIPPQFDPAAVLARLSADIQGSVTGFFSWSPDGRWVLFQAGEGAQTVIYRFDWKTGGQPVRLADGSSAAWQPVSSPEGR